MSEEWAEYRRLILKTLERQEEGLVAIRRDLSEHIKEFAVFKDKANTYFKKGEQDARDEEDRGKVTVQGKWQLRVATVSGLLALCAIILDKLI